jgi:hypothetical protein
LDEDEELTTDPMDVATESSAKSLGDAIKQKEMTENVEVVMTASRDAVVAAEATLPQELIEAFGANSSDIPATISTPVEDQVEIVPAEEVVGEPVTHTAIDAPPVTRILKFAIPAVGVW